MKKVINFVPTGTQPTRDNSLAPLDINEIVEDVHEAYDLGITAVHIHAREFKTHKNTYKKEVYRGIIEGIRKHTKDLVICTSLTGRNYPEIEKRTEVLSLQPDMGSLTMGSIDFNSSTTVNKRDSIIQLISKMEEHGVQPEIECFDSGMVNHTNYLIKKGYLKGPHYVNVILGNMFNAQSDIQTISALKTGLPSDSVVCFGGIGNQQLRSNVFGLLEADGIRVGLEDNLYYKGERKATNMELLNRVHRLMEELDMQCMSPTELRDKGYGNKYFNRR